LNISLEDFEKPENLSIKINCGDQKDEEEFDEEGEKIVKKVVIKEDLDF
jgi:hypothetical protein